MPASRKSGLAQIISLFVEEPILEYEWGNAADFDPSRLLDALSAQMRLEDDAALAHKLRVIQPVIRMVRERKLSMTPTMLLLWIQESTGITLRELRKMSTGESGP